MLGANLQVGREGVLRLKKLAAWAVMILGSALPAHAADVLYATGVGTGSGAGLSALYSINPTTGEATLLWNFQSIHIYGGGLAYDVASDSLYATGATNNSEEALYKIDRFAGTASLVGLMGTDAAFSQGGMSIDPTTGIMYATGANAGPNSGFYSVNKSTGTPTHVGQATGSFTLVYGLGFRADGTLFGNGIDENPGSKLFQVDVGSGATTLLGGHGLTLGRQLAYSGLAFRSDGVMVGFGSISASRTGLYTVDQTTGAAALIGDTGAQFGGDGGLAFAPGSPVPEPATAVVLSLGLTALLRKRPRRGA